jgi:pyruvate/2-oxoglutarate dehydrogenase complex dihydrolipoamide dehydrogenase (E3) component
LQHGFAELIDWRVSELARLGVDMRFGVDADVAAIAGMGADHVIVATGSRPVAMFGTVSAAEVLETDRTAIDAGSRVVVLDTEGHRKGIGTAEWLAVRGHRVTLVALNGAPAAMLDGSKMGPLALRRIRDLGVSLVEGHALVRVEAGGVALRRTYDDTPLFVEADHVVTASVHTPVDDLVEAVRTAGVSVRAIGDARAPRLVEDAIRDGYDYAATLD